MTAHFQHAYQVCIMDSAELINNELKCLNRWLKSNEISINADKTKCMQFSYNKNVDLSIINIGNNKTNETSVTKYFGIHLDNKMDFVKHITESCKVNFTFIYTK